MSFCEQLDFEPIFQGVFRRANPAKDVVQHVFKLYVSWLIEGHHKQVRNPGTGEMEPSPVMPSTIVHLLSSALVLNKLFDRPVVGLQAMRTAKEYARLHIPAEKVYLSLEDFEMLIRSLVGIFLDINLDSPSKDDRTFISHLLVFMLTVFPLYRCGNILNRSTKDTNGLTLSCFSFTRRVGRTQLLKIVQFEKTDSGPVPKRTIRWACATPEEIKAKMIGPPEVLLGYLKVYKKSLSTNASETILKPPTKQSKNKNSMLLQGCHLKWMHTLPGRINRELHSLPQEDGVPVLYNNRINRRTAISWHASVAPLHIVRDMAGHANASTTGLYVGATSDEIITLQANHQRVLLGTETPGFARERSSSIRSDFSEHPIWAIPPFKFLD